MLVTLNQLQENLTATLKLVKKYVDSRISVYLERDASNVYAEAEVKEEE